MHFSEHPISSDQLEKYKSVFATGISQWRLFIVESFLNWISKTLGHRSSVLIPTDLKDYSPEELKALQVATTLHRMGLVTEIQFEDQPYPDEPVGHVVVLKLPGMWRLGHVGKGADLFEREKAMWPAVGEAIERWALDNFYPSKSDYIDASVQQMKKPAIDILNVAGLTNEVRKKGHPQFLLEYDRNTIFRWTKTRSLISQNDLWAPLQWFSFPHVRKAISQHKGNEGVPREPFVSVPITTGSAAGKTLDHAIVAGLLEVIERDAFMIYWLNQIVADRIDLASCEDERFKKLFDVARRYRLEIHTLHLKTDVPVHTVLVVVIDRSGVGPAVMVSSKTGFDLKETAYACISGFLAQRSIYRRMMERNKDKLEAPKNIFEINHQERMLHWFQSHKVKDIEPLLRGSLKKVEAFEDYQYPPDLKSQLKRLLAFFRDNNYEVICKEVLSRRLSKQLNNIRVVMVRVPQFMPLYLHESLRGTEGDRLRTIPQKLGLSTTSQFSEDIHPFP